MRPLTQHTRLAKNILSLTIVKGSNFIIPLITLPYLVRVLGLDGYGIISFALSLAQFLAVCVQYGFNISATKAIARDKHDAALVNRHYSMVLICSGLIALTAFAVYLITISVFPIFREHFIVFLFSGIYLCLQALTPNWLFQGIEKMQYITFAHLGSRIMFLIGLFVLVKEDTDLLYVPALNMITTALSLLAAMGICRYILEIRLVAISWPDIKATLKEGLDIFLAQFAPNLYKNASVFILGVFTNETLVGAYSAALKLVEVAISGAQVIGSAVMPILSRNMQYHRQFSIFMLISGLALSAAFCFGSELILTILFSDTRPELVTSLEILSISIVFVYCHTAFGINYLMLIDKQNIVRNFTIAISMIGLVLLMTLIPLYGYYAALIVVLLNRFAIAAWGVFYYLEYRKAPHITPQTN